MVLKIRKIIFVLLIFLCTKPAVAQKKTVVFYAGQSPVSIKNMEEKKVEKSAYTLVSRLRKKGYWLASVDSISFADTVKVFLYRGKKIDKCLVLLDRAYGDTDSSYFSGFYGFDDFIRQPVARLNRNGYPYAHIVLDTFTLEPCKFVYKLYRGKYYTFDSIVVRNSPVNPVFLQRYTGIRPFSPYDKSKVSLITEKMDKLSFLSLQDKPVEEFHEHSVTLYLKLKKKNANTLDMLVGAASDGQKINLTGLVDLSLVNTLHWGEKFIFNWNKGLNNLQSLHSSFDMPYFFGLPVGVETNVDFLVKDTSEFHFDFSSGLTYSYGAMSNLGVAYVKNLDYTLLGDYTVSFSAVELTLSHDKGFDKSNGYKVVASYVSGVKSYNDTLSNFGWRASAFLGIAHSKNKWNLIGEGKSVISGGIQSMSEALYLGGARDFRGFDTYSLRATSYCLATVEPRYTLGAGSYLFLFGQYGFLELKTSEHPAVSRTTSFGAGFNLKQKNNTIYLIFALGGYDFKFDINDVKIHLGYKALF